MARGPARPLGSLPPGLMTLSSPRVESPAVPYSSSESDSVIAVSEHVHTFDPFCKEPAYIKVNDKLVDLVIKKVQGLGQVQLLDLAAGTGLMTALAYERARRAGVKLLSTLLDLDRPALLQARIEVAPNPAEYVYASVDSLPFAKHGYDAVIFANSLHLLHAGQKERALAESHRVLRGGGLLAMNTAFYEGSYPEESKPFYSRWIRRSIAEINQRLPRRLRGDRVQAMEFLTADGYRDLIDAAGFRVVEMRERRVLLSQSAVRAISSYKEFAKGALHATDEDAEEAAKALQATVQQTFRDLKMKYLPRLWLEIVAEKA
jgi:ubiquinone/menaquinone biosynthesis C-methylase UbiE